MKIDISLREAKILQGYLEDDINMIEIVRNQMVALPTQQQDRLRVIKKIARQLKSILDKE